MPRLAPRLNHLNQLRCLHKKHEPAGGERVDGKFTSARGAQYPAKLNKILAQSIHDHYQNPEGTKEDMEPIEMPGCSTIFNPDMLHEI